MILVQEVTNYREIQALGRLTVQSIYQFDDHERIFIPCTVEKPSWLGALFGAGKLKDIYYYVSPDHVSMVMEKDIRHAKTQGPVGVTMALTIGLDLVNSDSGKGLADWLAEHDWRMDGGLLKSFVKSRLLERSFEQDLGLCDMSWKELSGCHRRFGAEMFRDVLPHWLAVECEVIGAVEKMTQTQADRMRKQNEDAEKERRHQEELARLDRDREELEAAIEVQKAKNKLAELAAEEVDVEKQRQADLLRTVLDTLRPENDGQRTANLRIEGEPWPAERIVLDLHGVQLELLAKKVVMMGREAYRSDVVVKIPEGAMEEAKRNELNMCVSGAQALLEYRGGTVRLKNQGRYCTYLDGKEIPQEGVELAKDAEIGFSWEVRWMARIQECAGRLHLPCCDGCSANGVASMTLSYPGWTASHKVFVWQCCDLKQVDPRFPNWRVVYQSGAQGSEGAFYLLMIDSGRSVYLKSGQTVEENGVEMKVTA